MARPRSLGIAARHCVRSGASMRRRGSVSVAPRAHDRAVRAGRSDGRDRAGDRAEPERAVGPPGHRRQPRRRRRQHRHGPRRQCASGRLHRARRELELRRESFALREDSVRPVQELHSRDERRGVAERLHGAPIDGGEDHAGDRRGREEQSAQIQHRDTGCRDHAGSRRRASQDDDRRRRRSRSLRRSGAGGRSGRRQSGADRLDCVAADDASHSGWPAACARSDGREALRGSCRRAHDGRGGLQRAGSRHAPGCPPPCRHAERDRHEASCGHRESTREARCKGTCGEPRVRTSSQARPSSSRYR